MNLLPKSVSRGKLTHAIPKNSFQTAYLGIKKFGLLNTLGRFLFLQDERRRFLASTGHMGRRQRQKLLKQFTVIEHQIDCAHGPGDYVMIARHILESSVPGPIVECGAFKGGSSAKLSLVAHLSGRQLFICDSFAGLPSLAPTDRGLQPVFANSEYVGTLPEVKRNIKHFGNSKVCTYIPGFFNRSLKKLAVKPAFVVMDVDLVSSARDCLKYLWPQTQPGGIWFTHEASLPVYIKGVFDPAWWHEQLHQSPPQVVGAYIGATPTTPSMAYFKK